MVANDITVRALTEAEIPQHVALSRKSFHHAADPLNSLLYVHGVDPDLVAHFTYKTLKKFQRAEPNMFWIGAFARTPDGGEVMLATSFWVLEDDDQPCSVDNDDSTERAAAAPPGSHDEFYRIFFAQISQNRRPVMAPLSPSRPYWHLELLTTAPEHLRRGAGRALLQWGMDRADAEGRLMFLDATAAGRPLYAAAGFTEVGQCVMDGRQFGSPSCRCTYTMVRGVGGKPIEDAGAAQVHVNGAAR